MSFDDSASFSCLVCGARVPEGNRFCGSCGSAVTSTPRDVSVQPYALQGYPFRVRNRRSSGRKWSGWAVFFLFSFLFALGGWTPVLFNLSGWQARLTGVQTTALVTAVGNCDDGNYYMYSFTDGHGQNYQITDNSTCSSGIVSDGERVTIWYNPNKPSQFISANDLTFDMFFIVGFSIPLLIWIVLFVVTLVRRLLMSRTPGLVSWLLA